MADHPTDTVLAARQLRREQLAVLLSRAARGVLTPNEGPLLRAAVETELADANTAYLELDNQRETFDIAWEQQAAELERAREERGTYRAAWHSARDRARKHCAAVDGMWNANTRLANRARRAEKQLTAVRALHQRDDSNPLGPWCGTCSVPWPCRTAAALDGAQQTETAGGPELRPCGSPTCLPNGAHQYMLGRQVHQCPGSTPPAGEGDR
ncbi:hypothetical protein RM572_21820 [Streptomyces sp. DSM 42041]|uniref:Uncharacterized protein n=1 Tax=Streptomyces hazeniae TaxID=3075538 RepID=A0ABU2NXH7_9ACTN|nr:hypothetical protein [Streptomyces sp. DSM 42041]MDT0381400.1 hypothetical protein [Streptomyces sp. DSM 42041]